MKTFIAIPAMDEVDTLFVRSLTALNRPGESSVNLSESSLVYDSRNKLALSALVSGADYVLWLDSDMVFPADTLERLLDDIQHADVDMVCGLCFGRRPPYEACVFTKIRYGMDSSSAKRPDKIPAEPFEIDGCGFGCVLMKTSLLRAVLEQNNELFVPLPGYGEDIAFCIRAKNAGARIWCDPRIEIGHVGKTIVTAAAHDAWAAAQERKKKQC